ncbi:hypothetical protein [Klebsiella aerogenes]|uniref:hypothetical protein n=1 Tax=Klebsiella aerogenes TaxID=548 RepID=UPI000B113142|nr:hypothetical protein [Klebsiella aerogenes]EKU0353549.1 hypothetical protein [Klebsiella aerogenes]ELN9407334.1 hypothetical protein [Klebsiella aerogenes]RNT21999.1 hypothetical protein B9Z99_000145 [Klebsiella aerogenes]HBR6969013.1 hypothetical protein [Klebsiella aerogenes]HBY9540189.1 hypothetical protein [Klebsiella aerogenes]
MTKSQLTDLRTLILSEVGDFFAVFGSPGEPETPEEMQRELSMRLGRILNNHIVNYPRCEVLVEILRECRTARDEAQAELQERRKADSEPAMYVMGMGQALDAETASTCKGAVDSWVAEWNQSRLPGQADYKTVPLYRHAQPVPVVPDVLAKAFMSAIEKEQDRLSDEDYLMDSRGCIDVIREESERLNADMLAVASQDAK